MIAQNVDEGFSELTKQRGWSTATWKGVNVCVEREIWNKWSAEKYFFNIFSRFSHRKKSTNCPKEEANILNFAKTGSIENRGKMSLIEIAVMT
tara:strand:- start:1349 stop:1627 length:279 start_codon:yes stop_codon:yes gene_type:complete